MRVIVSLMGTDLCRSCESGSRARGMSFSQLISHSVFSEKVASQPDRGWALVDLWLLDDQQPLTNKKPTAPDQKLVPTFKLHRLGTACLQLDGPFCFSRKTGHAKPAN